LNIVAILLGYGAVVEEQRARESLDEVVKSAEILGGSEE
jgi:hypothetical protein